tara:strand:+ start:370 stop:708 length:339 start_codon:yes stop_codon:yes gene_type:complete
MGLKDFWKNMLAIYGQPWYNGTPERETGSASLTNPLQKDFTMSRFDYNTVEAKIQGLSIQVGELFADLWKEGDNSSDHALEAYKSLRRLLPTESAFSERHIGATAAHKATQG